MEKLVQNRKTINFVQKVILEWDKDKQNDFLRIYPALKISVKLIDIWIGIYEKSFPKSLSIDNQEIEKIKKMSSGDELIKAKEKFRENLMVTKGELIINKEKANIMNFLILGLDTKLLECSFGHINKILRFMHTHNEDPRYINRLKLDLIKYEIPKINPNRRSLSGIEFKDIVCRSDHTQFISNTARGTDIVRTIKDIDPSDFVMELTYKHYNLLKKISEHDLLRFSLEEDPKNNHVIELIKEFTKLSYYIPTELLLKKNDNKGRIKIIKKFIDIAQKCLQENNYFAFFAIIAGLANQSVQRITSLWNSKRKHTKKFNELEKLINPRKNYLEYRENIKGKTNYIPYLGVFFSDIKHLLENSMFDTKKGKLNFEIYDKLLEIITQFNSIKMNNLITNEKYSKFIDQLFFVHDDDQLYNRSLKIYKSKYPTDLSFEIKLEKIRDMTNDNDYSPPLLKRERGRACSVDDVNDSVRKIGEMKSLMCGSTGSVVIERKNQLIDSKGLEFIQKTFVENWTREQVLIWLQFIGLNKYENQFKDNEISGFSLVELNGDNLKEMGIGAIGHRIKILKNINILKNKSN